MAYVFIGQQDLADTTSTPSTTWDNAAYTPAAGNLLVCVVVYTKPTSSTTVALSDTTGSNGTWTPIDTRYDSGNAIGMAWFYEASSANTSSTIRATFGVNVTFPAVYIGEFSGLDSAPLLTSASSFASPGSTGADLITSGNTGTLGNQPALIFGFSWDQSQNLLPPVAGTGFTSLTAVWSDGSNPAARPEHKRVTTTTAVAATFTAGAGTGTDNFECLCIAFREPVSVIGPAPGVSEHITQPILLGFAQ